MSLDSAHKISQIISAFCMIITSAGTLAILCIAHRLTKSSKRIEVLVHCNSRFEGVLDLCLKTAVQRDPMIFYNRYWALQFDQFTYWLQGFVDDEIFRYWMMERHDAWLANPVFAGISYRNGWDKAMVGWTYTEFITFMKIVHERTADEAVNQYRPKKRLIVFTKRKQIA